MSRARQRSSTAVIASVTGLLFASAAWVWWCGRDAGIALAANPEALARVDVAHAVPATAVAVPGAAAERDAVEPAAPPQSTSEAVPEAVVDAAVVARLVDDLRDDDVPQNGMRAFSALCKLPRGRLAAVEAALASSDLQQSVYAGGVLRRRCRELGDQPSAALLAETVATMRRDVRVDVWCTGEYPLAAASLRFLVDHVAAAREPLERALTAGDEQQRFFAAYLLANVADERLVPRIVRELALHLEDNEIGGDAVFASHGLYRLGALGLPAVRAWRGSLDEQGRALLDLVELDVRSPPRDAEALRERKSRHQVTTLYHDPVVEYDLSRSCVPSW